ncbi:hypothetical protein N9K77_01775 [bacterium]|nr:hypothetical protein [bacterium]
MFWLYNQVRAFKSSNTFSFSFPDAIERIKKSNKDLKDLQVGFIAMNKKGEIGS